MENEFKIGDLVYHVGVPQEFGIIISVIMVKNKSRTAVFWIETNGITSHPNVNLKRAPFLGRAGA